MKPVYFNELTLDSRPAQNALLLRDAAQLFKAFFSKTRGANKNKIFATDEALGILSGAVYGCGNPLLVDIFTHFFAPKYEPDQERRMSEHEESALYGIVIDGVMRDCKTMGFAAHEGSVTLGFLSTPFWGRLRYSIERMDSEGEFDQLDAICLTRYQQVGDREILEWFRRQLESEHVGDVVVEPPESKIPFEEKQRKYNDVHHERELRRDFCEQILRYKFVDGVIDDLPQNSQRTNFIEHVDENGVIDVRMHWTPRGSALRVKTTAKGTKQTLLVAALLKEKFDRMS